jgi:hypothetical protein
MGRGDEIPRGGGRPAGIHEIVRRRVFVATRKAGPGRRAEPRLPFEGKGSRVSGEQVHWQQRSLSKSSAGRWEIRSKVNQRVWSYPSRQISGNPACERWIVINSSQGCLEIPSSCKSGEDLQRMRGSPKSGDSGVFQLSSQLLWAMLSPHEHTMK